MRPEREIIRHRNVYGIIYLLSCILIHLFVLRSLAECLIKRLNDIAIINFTFILPCIVIDLFLKITNQTH